MKTTNRVAGKGDSKRPRAQSKASRRPAKVAQTRATRNGSLGRLPKGAAKPAAAQKPPCHRLAPRSAAECAELKAFTANLGAYVASCVFAGGDVQHLYQSGPHFFMVTEALAVRWADGREFGLSETLWNDRVSLAEFVKSRPAANFSRVFAFEPLPPGEIAEWAERNEVAERLPIDVKRALWGRDEADGEGSARLVLSTVRTTDHGGRERIYARCGSFTLEIEATGEVRPISRDDVVFRLRNFLVLPLLQTKVPPGFHEDFNLACLSDSEDRSPAEPADVLSPATAGERA